MLSDKDTKLLTGLVDGELSDHSRKSAIRLLKKSPQARKLFEDLRSDSSRLNSLSRTTITKDFPVQVMREIMGLEKPVAASLPVAAAAPSSLPAWAPIAVAAAILLAVAAGSFLFFANTVPDQDQNQFVQEAPVELPKLQFSIAELGQGRNRDALSNELRKDDKFQLEVNCKDPAQAVERFKKLMKKNGINVVVDSAAEDALENGKGSFVMYVDNVYSYDVSTMLYDLGQHEGDEPSSVTKVALYSLDDKKRKQAAEWFGVSPEEFTGRMKDEKTGAIRPIMPKNGRGKKKSPGNKSGTSQRRTSAVLTLASASPRTAAPADAVRQFFGTGREREPGTLQVVFVINTV